MPLHLDYRPWTLDEVQGNETTVSALRTWLAREDRCHSLLFTGAAGCGKTTMARIIANELGALNPEKTPAENPDYVELNTSDFRGVDMVRELRQQVAYMPTLGDCRVWLLDEAHMLTAPAQEALLKLLEEAPSHVYFLVATTNPEKLKATFRRRCTPFAVEPLQEEDMLELLNNVLKDEKKEVPERLLSEIAQDAAGSPGTALMVLDKIVGLEPEEMRDAAKQAVERAEEVRKLCQLLLKGAPWKQVARTLEGLTKEDPERMRRAVLGYMMKVMLGGRANAAAIMSPFLEPVYNTGWPGLVYAAAEAVCPV